MLACLSANLNANTPRKIQSSVKEKLNVTVMKINDFLAFSVLENYCTWRTLVAYKGAFQKAKQIIVSQEFPESYVIKLHYNLEDTPATMMKTPLTMTGPGGKGKGRGKGRGRGRPSQQPSLDFNLGTVVINRKYQGEVIEVNQAKLRDLALLKPYMSESGKKWVDEFLAAQRNEFREEPSIVHEDPDDPDDDYAMDYEEVRRIAEA